MKILVIGGTGLIGKPVVRSLVEAGHSVAVGGRSRQLTQRLFGDKVIWVQLDFTNPTNLHGKFAGFDAIHLSLPSGPRFEDCFRNEVGGTRNVVAEAIRSDIKRISYLSGATNLTIDHPFPPVRAKFQAEEAIKTSGIPYTIWRASWFMDTLPKMAVGGSVGILGKGEAAPHWIAGDDFGKMVTNALSNENTIDKTLYVFGPAKVSLNNAARIFRDACHPYFPILHLPISLISFLASVTRQHEMWFGAQMLRFLDVETEYGDASEANRLVGPSTTTIEQFCRDLNKAAA